MWNGAFVRPADSGRQSRQFYGPAFDRLRHRSRNQLPGARYSLRFPLVGLPFCVLSTSCRSIARAAAVPDLKPSWNVCWPAGRSSCFPKALAPGMAGSARPVGHWPDGGQINGPGGAGASFRTHVSVPAAAPISPALPRDSEVWAAARFRDASGGSKSCSKARLKEIYRQIADEIMAAIAKLEPHEDKTAFP